MATWYSVSCFLKKKILLNAGHHIKVNNIYLKDAMYTEGSQGALETLQGFIHGGESATNKRRIYSSCLSAHGNMVYNRMRVANWHHGENLLEQNAIIAPRIGLDIIINTLFLGKAPWTSYYFSYPCRSSVANRPGRTGSGSWPVILMEVISTCTSCHSAA